MESCLLLWIKSMTISRRPLTYENIDRPLFDLNGGKDLGLGMASSTVDFNLLGTSGPSQQHPRLKHVDMLYS